MSAGHPGVIAGVVVGDDGAPVEGARVYLVDAPVAIPDVAAQTQADGRFSLSAPAGGSYTLECTADGAGSARATVMVGGGESDELTLRLT